MASLCLYPVTRANAAGIGENEPIQRLWKKKQESNRVWLPPVCLHAESTPNHERTKSVRRFDMHRFALEATAQVLNYGNIPDATKPREVETSDGNRGRNEYEEEVERVPPAEAHTATGITGVRVAKST